MIALPAHAVSAVLFLADTGDSGDSGEGNKAGPIGLAVILLLIIACAFLFKSMSKHLRKVRESFPAEGVAVGAGPTATTEPPVDGAAARSGVDPAPVPDPDA